MQRDRRKARAETQGYVGLPPTEHVYLFWSHRYAKIVSGGFQRNETLLDPDRRVRVAQL